MTSKIAVLLLNLGTPDNPSKASVKRFLADFLDDPRVIDLPWIVRKVLLNAFILPFRSSQTAKAYSTIWDEKKGSPLLFHTKAFSQSVQSFLGAEYVVEIGMRYGNPSIADALKNLSKALCHKLIVIPLFPQYSSAATGSAIEKVLSELQTQWHIPTLIVRDSFFNDQNYIAAQAEQIQPYLTRFLPDKILFSYHSLPVRHIQKTKAECFTNCFINHPCERLGPSNQHCYRAQCFETSRLLAKKLNLTDNQFEVVFQSRLGRTKWIGPELQETLKTLIQQNVKNIVIASPSFVADCLETLEEIGERISKQWKVIGGSTLHLVPALNSQPSWVKFIGEYIQTV